MIVSFKYEKKDDVAERILKKAELKNSIAGIVFELVFRGISFRLYPSGKAIFRGIKNRQALLLLLKALLA